MSADPAVWIAAIFTLVTFSFLWKSNYVYRLAEHVLLAIATGHAVVLGYENVRNMGWTPLVTKGQYSLIIPLILGLLLYTRYVKSVSWWSRIPTAVIIGCGTAMALRGSLQAELLQQIAATAFPMNSIESWLVLLGVAFTVVYFIYTYKAAGTTGGISRIGRIMMMIGFGAAFGSATGRLALVVGRFQFLMRDWLGIIK